MRTSSASRSWCAKSIGLKDDRGDQIDVMNQAFKNNGPIGPIDGPPLWQNPMVGQIAKQLVGAGLVLLVAFLILRPLMKSLTKGGKGGHGEPDRRRGGRGSREPVGQGRRQSDQAVAEFRAADRGGSDAGGAGSEAGRTSSEGLGCRRWLASRVISQGPNAPRSCS